VVDDDPDVVGVVSFLLKRAGYEVATALNGREALRECHNGGADLVILDIMMPGLSGLAVMRGMRRMFAGAPPKVIVFSGLPNLSDEAVQKGACATLQKPCDLASLLSLVHETLEH
jgi:two-component system alkaline phosphatase synthesis response regulator PhoP